MKYRLTPHAQARIAERKTPLKWLSSVMEASQQHLADNHGREIRQSIFELDDKRWLLRVIMEGNLVLTVLLTSKNESATRSPS